MISFLRQVVQVVQLITGLGKGFSILFAGNFGVVQGVIVIVEATILLLEYSDIHFVVIGDSSCRDEIMS